MVNRVSTVEAVTKPLAEEASIDDHQSEQQHWCFHPLPCLSIAAGPAYISWMGRALEKIFQGLLDLESLDWDSGDDRS